MPAPLRDRTTTRWTARCLVGWAKARQRRAHVFLFSATTWARRFAALPTLRFDTLIDDNALMHQVYVRFANSTIRRVIALFESASGSQIVK
jgi:hypothetical protein